MRDSNKFIGFPTILCGLTCFVLTGCSSESDSIEPETEPETELVTSPPELEFATASSSGLALVGERAVRRFVRNGVYLRNKNMSASDVAAPPEVNIGGNNTRGFSVTNTQEIDVDEADRLEYDGEFMYVADVPIWQPNITYQSGVRVLQRQSDDSLEQIAYLEIEKAHNIGGLYLSDSHLSTVSQDFPSYPINIIGDDLSPPWASQEHSVNLDIFDVSQALSPTKQSAISIQGNLVNSRRVGDYVYLVSQHVLDVDGLLPFENTEQSLVDNYNRLVNTPDEAFIPSITIDGTQQPLFEFGACVLPANTTPDKGNAQMLSIVRIDVKAPSAFESICMSASAQNLYMSSESLYLTSEYEDATLVHKFTISNTELEYEASGLVQGRLGGRGPANLRLSEHNGNLRMLTSDYNNSDDPEHRLSVLQQSGNRLEVLSQLPNEQADDPIGKPGEDVYAVRFYEDKAYVVTFERIDPLYIINLDDPAQPFLEGELEIPGFSSYLHPINDSLVLGVGQDISLVDLSESGGEPRFVSVSEGVKLSLFDVSDPQNPIEKSNLIWPDSYTPVEYNYRALSVLEVEDTLRFAFPVGSWLMDESGNAYHQNALQALEVDMVSGNLSAVNRLQAEEFEGIYISNYEDRSVIHGDRLYYLRGNLVFKSTWSEGAQIDGPY